MTFQALKDRLAPGARAFRRDQRGSVIVMIPVFFLVAAGFASLAVDMGHLYSLRGELQNTADAAALAAANDLPEADDVRATAVEYATKNMPVAEHGTVLANADAVTGNWDAGTRTFTPAGSPANAVRVVTRRSEANGNAAGLFFARILGFDQADVEASAIASSQGGRDICVIALDPSVDDALRIGGGANVEMACGAQVNSTSNRALRVNGGGCITASSISVGGNTQGNCINPTADTGMTPYADPLAYLDPPSYPPLPPAALTPRSLR